ncbi:hypothetical protein OG824_31855 [Streptomyces prunicolor]|uniref:hypothetical protein n=1 Tax=Streptomyces prunicolor TaxID=67348 RepID=UPI002251F5F2|nr:hypothetical protein [Streptomyces prunicolor]MCX5239806.1 hypothetical protein [Streptomyces prunicolor]
MTGELAVLEAAYFAALEAHKSHPPRLRRGRDGVYRCAACDPAGRWERAADWLRFNRSGWTRRASNRYAMWHADIMWFMSARRRR